MKVFRITDNFKQVRILESTMAEESPKPWKNEVIELYDESNNLTYFFKHANPLNHRINIDREEIFVNKSLAKELLTIVFASEVGINHCSFCLAYYPKLDKYGIMTLKHENDPRTLLELSEIVEKRVGNCKSDEFSLEMIKSLANVNISSIIDLFKMHVCDAITFSTDRHENNILFTDSSYSKIYPYFDCDMSFCINNNQNLENITVDDLLRYNLKTFRLLNLAYCYTEIIGRNVIFDLGVEPSAITLLTPDEDIIKETVKNLYLRSDLVEYLIDTVDKMNKYFTDLFYVHPEKVLNGFIELFGNNIK